MSDNLVPILLITLTIVLLIILFIVMSYVLLRLRWLEGQRTGGEEPLGGTPPQGGAAPAKGGSLSGFRGKAIWDALENPGKHPSIIDQLRSRYAFVLARHIESVIDQGSLIASATKNRFREQCADWRSTVEVQSGCQSYVQRFYRVGSQSLTATAEELAELGPRYALWAKFSTGFI